MLIKKEKEKRKKQKTTKSTAALGTTSLEAQNKMLIMVEQPLIQNRRKMRDQKAFKARLGPAFMPMSSQRCHYFGAILAA